MFSDVCILQECQNVSIAAFLNTASTVSKINQKQVFESYLILPNIFNLDQCVKNNEDFAIIFGFDDVHLYRLTGQIC